MTCRPTLAGFFLLSSCASAHPGVEPAEPVEPATVEGGQERNEAAPVESTESPSTEPPPTELPLTEPRRVVVEDPGLDARFAEADRPPPTVRLQRTHSRRNEITDDDRWLGEHDIGHVAARPTDAPPTVGGEPFLHSSVGEPQLAAYGPHPNVIHHLWLAQQEGPATILDLRNLMTDGMAIADARRVGDRVYLTRAHRTYASSTNGKNAYLVALDATDGAVIWVSEPLTSNTLAFTGRGRVLYTGYGFTNEPDHLYAVDRFTGRRLAELELRKGPTYLVLTDDDLHVRTYDRDVTVRVTIESDE